MQKTNVLLKALIIETYDEYCQLSEEITSIKLAEDKWSLKEIIGHLIDSASNNHQRFVRLQLEEKLVFPSYHYSWVELEKYNSQNFNDIILLWKQYNLLLIHIIENTKEDSLKHTWQMNPDKSITLEDLIIDYTRHLKEHLKQFEERLAEIIMKTKIVK